MKNNIGAKNSAFLKIELLRKKIFYDTTSSPPVPTEDEPTNHKQWGNFIAAHRELNQYLSAAEKRTDIIIVIQERYCSKKKVQYGFMVEYATRAVDFEEQSYRIQQYGYKQVYDCIPL